MEMLKQDIEESPFEDAQLPMSGVFPEPRYDIQMEGTCNGVGSGGGERIVAGRKIFYDYLIVGRNVNNAPFIGDREDEMFFLILTLTDVDESWEDAGSSSVLSRNNPDFMGMGSLPAKNSGVDYIAFLTASRDNYAIVNSRLFDLQLGRTVLIAPQKDGSFRSMQLESPLMGSAEVETYVNSVLATHRVRNFFLAAGNIQST
jgi:hypothetical protein